MTIFPITEPNSKILTLKDMLSLYPPQNIRCSMKYGFFLKGFKLQPSKIEVVGDGEGNYKIERKLTMLQRAFLFTMKTWNRLTHGVREVADVIDVEVGVTRKAVIATPAEVEYCLRVRNTMRLAEWYHKLADLREEQELAHLRELVSSDAEDSMRYADNNPRSLEYGLFQAEVTDVRMGARRMASVPERKKGNGVLTCSSPFLNPMGLTYRRSYTARLQIVSRDDGNG